MKNSIAAYFAAIEIHNKPNISYRYETVTLLIMNAWELALTLYTIQNNFFKLQALAEEGILDPDELEESLQELELDAEDICENMAKMIRQFEADNAALDVEIKRLQKGETLVIK